MSDKSQAGLAAMSMDRQCTATSKQSGERCRRLVPVGHVVCHYHGGASKHAKDKARLRLLELVEPAVGQLARLMVNSADERVQLRAIENILDRGGIPRGMKIDGTDARTLLVQRLQTYRAEAGIDTAAAAADVAEIDDDHEIESGDQT